MKKDMPLEGLRWSRDSGSALYDTPQNGRSRTGWGAVTTVDTDLKVADGETKGDGNIYCLANKASNGVGFYQVSSSVIIPANKAYLEIGTPATTHAKYYSIGIGGNTTGIQAIQQNGVKADGIMYSLSGQKVGENYKGIVICNGKKMIKK